MANTETTLTNEKSRKVKAATTRLRNAFIKVDSRWNACGKEDSMGIYRFLTGKYGHTMEHLFKRFEGSIATIKTYGEREVENARLESARQLEAA
jgi:hypothetical protein